MLKVPDVQILEVEEKKTKQWVIILRSFSILPSHSAVGTSETGYHYYSKRLQRYHICNILQGVYEVLLCRCIQTNQIGTIYEPFSCCIGSFVNVELQILLISMLIFTCVLSMLLRWIVLKHNAIWKTAQPVIFFTVLNDIYKGLVVKFTQAVIMIFQPSCVYLLYHYVIK